uniref:Uncharacterized protein n=1 Tax=Rhodopseudomonas palustris (strain BisA53) TaxID=316055 RepID=Q07NV4_RHOP5
MQSIILETDLTESIHCQPGVPQRILPLTNPPNAAPDFPLRWWRTREPLSFSPVDLAPLRRCLIRDTSISEPQWIDAVTGDPASAIGVGVALLRQHGMCAIEIDLGLSAALACAIEGDVTTPILIASALRRRGKIDPACRILSDLWLNTRF